MNIKDLINDLAGPGADPDERTVRDFIEACRRVDEVPQEGQRYRNIADLIDAEDALYDEAVAAVDGSAPEIALRLLRLAADWDIGDAAWLLAVTLHKSGQIAEAITWYERAARDGDARAAAAPSVLHVSPTAATRSDRFKSPTRSRKSPLRILVLGGDGYLGWPTALHLSEAGHQVAVADNFVRRHYDNELGVESLVPIEPLRNRIAAWRELTGKQVGMYVGDLTDPIFTYHIIRDFEPDAVVHFAEQRAAPYSMIDRAHAVYTQANNVVGNLNLLYAIAETNPDIHLVKLGTMGEYGTPNIDIEEGWLDLEHNGRTDRVLFPKRPGSFYELSKVHDSHNIEFACRIWDLRATDLNMGLVYGQETDETARDERLATRFDYDAVFGTVLNRFTIQAVIGHPLTVYGEGGQTRGIIEIRDTVRCIQLACENPANRGEFRVFNQITEWMSVKDIAETVKAASFEEVTIEYLDNPRVEAPEHYYNVKHTALVELGLEPHLLSKTLIESLFDITKRYAHRVRLEALRPTVKWRDPTAG